MNLFAFAALTFLSICIWVEVVLFLDKYQRKDRNKKKGH